MYKTILCILLAVAVTGCDQKHKRTEISRPWKTEVKRTSVHDDINFGSGSSKINSKEADKLRSLVFRSNPNTPMYARLLVPEAKVKAKQLQGDRVDTIVRCLVKMGVAKDDIEVVFLDRGEDSADADVKAPNNLTVIIDQYTAIPPKCPGWDQIMNGQIPPEGEMNFGCANEVNFAKMIATPRDIQKGRDLESSDGRHNSMAVERYKTDKIKTLKIETIATVAGG